MCMLLLLISTGLKFYRVALSYESRPFLCAQGEAYYVTINVIIVMWWTINAVVNNIL